jgi:hypothetical protein
MSLGGSPPGPDKKRGPHFAGGGPKRSSERDSFDEIIDGSFPGEMCCATRKSARSKGETNQSLGRANPNPTRCLSLQPRSMCPILLAGRTVRTSKRASILTISRRQLNHWQSLSQTNMSPVKVCRRCGEERPISEFRVRTVRTDRGNDVRRVSYCKGCEKELARCNYVRSERDRRREQPRWEKVLSLDQLAALCEERMRPKESYRDLHPL